MVLLVRSRQLFNFTTRHGCRHNRRYTTTPPSPPPSPQNKEPFSPLTKHLRDSVKVNNNNNESNNSNDKKEVKKNRRIYI